MSYSTARQPVEHKYKQGVTMFTQEDIQGMVNETMSQVTNAIADPTQSVFWGSINAGTTILKEFKIDTDMSDVEPELQVSKENQILLWSRIYAYSCIMQSLYLSKASEVTIEDISNMFDNALKGVAFTIGKNASKSPYSPMLHINGTGIICRL